MMQEKDLQECKFQPELKSEMPNYDSKDPIMLKGFAKYVDQMEKARRAKREKEEREKEVFITGENWSPDNLITVPKPFNLSYQNASKKKKEEIKKKNEELIMKECTFKPATNES
jgi:hypothetical protein